MSTYDVIIIGAGAAGLMCAIEAGKRGRSVLLIEGNDAVGAKIRISGGGRCNFTNRIVGAEHFTSANPHFAKSALSRFTPGDMIELIGKHRIPYHEKKLGQLFCDGRATAVIDMLLHECRSANVHIMLKTHVTEILPGQPFTVRRRREAYESSAVVIATGGLSVSKLGATDFGYRVARQVGLNIVTTRPGLVPLTFRGPILKLCQQLSGVSLEACVSTGDVEFHENILFTHRGMSGPSILQISSYWEPGKAIRINLLPGINVLPLLLNERSRRVEMQTILSQYLPERFVKAWLDLYGGSKPMNQWSLEAIQKVARTAHDWELIPSGTEGYEKAEVTAGGVDTRELSSRTMETKQVKGLYFVGEVVDVTGWLGGFNFQWAWASGFAAGQAI